MVYQAGFLGLRRLPIDHGSSRPDCTCRPFDPLRSDDSTGRSPVLVRPKPETCLLVARVRVPSLDGPGVLHRGRLVAEAHVVYPRRVSSNFARVHKARHNEPALGAMGRVEHLLGNHVGVLHSRAPRSVSRSLVRAAQQGVAADHQQLGSIDLGCCLAAYLGDRVGSGRRCCWPLNADPLGGRRHP